MRSSEKRRTVLHAMTTAGLAAVTGWSMFGGRGAGRYPRLARLRAVNADDRPHTVRVRIHLAGETLYRASERVASAEESAESAEGGPGSAEEDASSTQFTGVPSKPEPYEIHARVGDGSASSTAVLDVSDLDADCVRVRVEVGDSETETPNLDISATACPDGDAE